MNEILPGDKPVVEERSGKVRIHIPMRLKRKSGRKEVVYPGGVCMDFDNSAVRKPMVVAIARGLLWLGLLEEGGFGSVGELAEAVCLDHSYIMRMLSLATLAPDIIQAILEGEEPDGLSLEKLKGSLPLSWEDQRAVLRGLQRAGPLRNLEE